MRLTLTSPALLATDTLARRLTGVAIPYGVFGNTSAGRLCVDAGAVTIPENLRTVKLFTEHGRTTPTGYATGAEDSPEQLAMEFSVARTPAGDQALLEASEGVRDALSVELDNLTIEAGHVTSADLVAVAQVALPAFAGAQLVATLTDDEQANVNDLATQIVEATAPDQPTEDTTTPPPDAAATTEQEPSMTTASLPATAAPAPDTAPAMSMTPPAPTRRDPGAARRLYAAQVSEAMRGASDAGQVNAALSDITPGNAGTNGVFPRPAWLGELWSPLETNRPVVNAIGVSPLTAMEMDGWKWTTKPQVAPYAGNKQDVPSNQAVITPAQATAQRIAGGWDLDRIYVDFNTGFVDAFLRAATADYQAKSATYFLSGHAAITGPPAVPAADGIIADATDLGVQADVMAAIEAIAGFIAGNGANLSFLAMASDVFSNFLGLGAAQVPWWLQNQGTINLSGSTDVAGVTIAVDPGLGAGQLLGGDRKAVTLWETGPINVQAVNVPQGGVDLGLFGYWAQQVHDPAGLAKATATLVAAEQASSRAAKKTAAS